MLSDDVKKILGAKVEEVIKSPELSLSLLNCYSVLYLNGGQPRVCEKSQRQYYTKLKKDGMSKAKKKEKQNTCKPNWKGLKYVPGMATHLNSANLPDEKAISGLVRGFLKESDFKVLPEGLEDAQKAFDKNAAAFKKLQDEAKAKKQSPEKAEFEAEKAEFEAEKAEFEAEKAEFEAEKAEFEAGKSDVLKTFAEDTLDTLESLKNVNVDLLRKLVKDLCLSAKGDTKDALIKALEAFREEDILD